MYQSDRRISSLVLYLAASFDLGVVPVWAHFALVPLSVEEWLAVKAWPSLDSTWFYILVFVVGGL